MAEPINQQEDTERLSDRLKGIIGRLESEATSRVAKRQHIEQRWIEDLEQYHGQYDAKTRKALNDGENKSKLNINLTRPKTDAMSARLMDLLFPTDDRNWGISPTPVPSLTEAAEQAASTARQLAQQAKDAQEQAPEGQMPPDVAALQQQADVAQQKASELQGMLDEARKRADLMTEEIADQLNESLYHAAARDQIEDAAKLGTGVVKGPVTGDKVRKGWKKPKVPATNPDGSPAVDAQGKPVLVESKSYELKMSVGEQPAMRHVDIWSFFPDMDVAKIDDAEGVFERHLMNVKKLKRLAGLPGFDKDAIRRLLKGKPSTAAPAYVADLRNITGANDAVSSDFYHVWEYTGPLSADDMHDLALAMGDESTVKDMEEVDPLTELNAVVWFCQGEVLKFSIYPYDSGECMYSVFNLAKDENSIFGYGLPSIMRDPAKSLNAAWRAMMDNAGLASGPQVVVAKGLIEPADGKWELTPRKLWIAKEGLPQNHRAFDAFNVPTQQEMMGAIIQLSKQFIDDMTGMPAIAQGEQGTGVTKTAQGMALLMNSANVVFRRIVKNFDDDVTTPNIRRFYDWNMQFSKKEEIKGDYEIDARGSSVLLVREMQAQNLMMIALQLGGHPVYGPMLKNRDLLRKLFQANMIPANEVILSDDEIDAVLAKAAAQAAEMEASGKGDPELEGAKIELEREKMEKDIELANMEIQGRKDIEIMRRETAMMQTAERLNMSMDQIEARLAQHRETIASKERTFAAEAAMTERAGPTGGGHF